MSVSRIIWESNFASGTFDSESNMPDAINKTTRADASQVNALRNSLISVERRIAGQGGNQSSAWYYLDMNLPTDIVTQPSWLYAHDGSADTLKDRSGHSNHLTIMAGSAVHQRIAGLMGLVFDETFYLQAAAHASFQIAGDLTVEFLMYLSEISTVEDYFFYIGGDGETEAKNTLAACNVLDGTGKFKWFSEHDVAVNDFISLGSMMPVGQLMHVGFTRNATNVVRSYLDGEFVATGQDVNVPTGGGQALLTIGSVVDGTKSYHGIICGSRGIGALFSDAQMLESYQRCKGIVY